MARGWESKSVESQQADRESAGSPAPALSPEEREAADRRRTVALALARARADLAVAVAPGYRAMLQLAILALEDQMRRESGPGSATV